MLHSTEPDAQGGLPRWLVIGGVLAGMVIRIVILSTPLGRPDSDEVIAGLMARHLGAEPFPLWFWGQHYGGTPQLVPVAMSMKLFGSSLLAMRLPGIVMGGGSCVLLWRIGRRLLPESGAQLAALIAWVWSPAALWLSVREMLIYVPVVFAGLSAALFAFRLREGRGWRNAVGMVVAIALGLWMNPSIGYFVVPTALVVAAPHARRLLSWVLRATHERAYGKLVFASAAGLAASAVVLVVGRFALDAARRVPELEGAMHLDHFVARLAWFFTDGLPGLLGFREMLTYRWIYGPFGVALYLLTLALVVGGLAMAMRRRAWDGLGLLAVPFLLALVPHATVQPNMRYLFFAVPFLALAIARVVACRARLAPVALALAVLVTGIGLHRIYVISEIDKAHRIGGVGDLDEVLAVLEVEQIHAVYAGYWIAFRLDFESEERIVAVPPFGESRYPPYRDIVRADPRSAWVVENGYPHVDLMSALVAINVGARELPAGEFTVVIPDRPVQPEEISGGDTPRIDPPRPITDDP